MLQVISNCYYLVVQKKLERLGAGMVLLWPPKNSAKTGIQMIRLLVNQLK